MIKENNKLRTHYYIKTFNINKLDGICYYFIQND